MEEWKVCKLNDIDIEVIDGDRGKNYPHQNEFLESGFCLFLSAKNVTKTGFSFIENQYISQEKDSLLNKGKLKRGDIVITTRGTVGNVAIFSEEVPYNNIRINSGMLIIRCGKTINNFYLYHVLRSELFYNQILSIQSGSAQPQLPKSHFLNMMINLPPLPTQQKIAAILSSLDDKIELNNKINENLEQQAQALFKSWFIDFEPFGGKMPEGWKEGTVAEIIELHDSKRIPLSSQQREKMEKIYPYYGATSLMDYVDDYLFDGIYLLLGEDGTVINSEGFPILQYVEGKFWVNNHAHILTGKNGFSVEMLYLLFSLTNVKDKVTGAVQPKISQGNLNSIKAIILDMKVCKEFDSIIQPLFAQIRTIRNENNQLTTIRDTLLPKLMNGEIDIDKTAITIY